MMRKTILSLALVLAMLLSLSSIGLSAYADGGVLTQREMTFDICNVEDAQTWTVYFPADSDVPYISLRDWAALMPYILHTYVREGDVCTFALTYSMAGKTGFLTREDGYFAEFDCANGTILFEDYDAFLRGDSTKVLIDVLGADEALYRLITLHLDDLHSSFIMPSPLTDPALLHQFREQSGEGRAEVLFVRQYIRYLTARHAARPDGLPACEEVGNTACITFDSFTGIPDGVDYYETAPTAEAEDTIGIMLYAYSQIMREGSPVENVVLDLSCNTGGDVDAAVFTISAFLGEGYVSILDTLSGGMATGSYEIDLNLDGQFDDGDLGLLDKKLFCLTSPVSFSCGNLVPNVFKNSNMVTLLGRTSGGGSCLVLPMSTAYGTAFQLSGLLRLAFPKNGSFYDIDQGATPDFTLSDPASFYDRAALTEYINSLM